MLLEFPGGYLKRNVTVLLDLQSGSFTCQIWLKIVTSQFPQWAITLGPFTKAINTLAFFTNISLVRDHPTIDANKGWRKRWEIRVGCVLR